MCCSRDAGKTDGTVGRQREQVLGGKLAPTTRFAVSSDLQVASYRYEELESILIQLAWLIFYLNWRWLS